MGTRSWKALQGQRSLKGEGRRKAGASRGRSRYPCEHSGTTGAPGSIQSIPDREVWVWKFKPNLQGLLSVSVKA